MEEHLYDDDGLPIDLEKPIGEGINLFEFSLDPYAGLFWGDKEIWSPIDAMNNLLRANVSWNTGNSSGLEDGVLTFGFWPSLEAAQNSYYLETDEDGYVITTDSVHIYYGNFQTFTPEQQDAARATMQLWDDLIAISIQEAPIEEADITFGFVQMSPAAGAHAFYPQEDALNAAYGYEEAGRIAGDVWLNYLYGGAFEENGNAFADMSIGSYGWFTLAHELGHSLGLPHGGQYNASYDGPDEDTDPDPIAYGSHAYFAQDTQQYTIMSYFDGMYTGQNAFRWNSTTGGTWMMAQTPAVHDILAIQQLYGADYTTRAGDTVYGFNSNADRDVFDFTVNDTPIVTIWDGGGTDTLDLSGFNSDAIININQGAFSSAGYTINPDLKALLIANGWTEADFDALYAAWGLGPDGRPVDNIAIAYGAEIENAVGGSGNDQMIGNTLNNSLVGNDGDDTIGGGAGDDTLDGGNGIDSLNGGSGNDSLLGGNGDDFLNGGSGNDGLVGANGVDTLNGGSGNDSLNGGRGSDIYVFANTGTDTIVGYELGERIDLSAFDITMEQVTISANGLFVELGENDLVIQFNTSNLSGSDIYFG